MNDEPQGGFLHNIRGHWRRMLLLTAGIVAVEVLHILILIPLSLIFFIFLTALGFGGMISQTGLYFILAGFSIPGFANHLLIHWLSENARLKSFAPMICALLFIHSAFLLLCIPGLNFGGMWEDWLFVDILYFGSAVLFFVYVGTRIFLKRFALTEGKRTAIAIPAGIIIGSLIVAGAWAAVYALRHYMY